MTDHLPECNEREVIGLDCICDRLRACEERVTREWAEVSIDDDVRVWNAALDSAQDDLDARIVRERSEGDADGLLDGLLYARDRLDTLKERP